MNAAGRSLRFGSSNLPGMVSIAPASFATACFAKRELQREARVAVTPEQMRLFALECLRWSEEAENASQRDLMIRIARTWMNTAAGIERRQAYGEEAALPDLRTKLD